jgi:FKBP-type peptidyl-prolyl cis-trans isomerase (trigger factor)
MKKRLNLILCLLCACALLFALSACGDEEEVVVEDPVPVEDIVNQPLDGDLEPLTALQIEDVTVGEGPEVVEGDTVVIDWTGYYMDGMMWNSSVQMGEPYTFVVGAGDVIEGWDVGVLGMQQDGERTLLVPADMAFGAEGAHPMVSPDQDLQFEITLLAINP